MKLLDEDCDKPYVALNWWHYVERDCKYMWFSESFSGDNMRREMNVLRNISYELFDETCFKYYAHINGMNNHDCVEDNWRIT